MALALALLGTMFILRGVWVWRHDQHAILCAGNPLFSLHMSRHGGRSPRGKIATAFRFVLLCIVVVFRLHLLFVNVGCRYDLRGLQADSQGRVTCPECGVCRPVRRCIRTPRRLRWNRIGLCLLALAPYLGHSAAMPWRRIAERMPA